MLKFQQLKLIATEYQRLGILSLFNCSHSEECITMYLAVVLIFISLMTNYVENLFICLLATWTSSCEISI